MNKIIIGMLGILLVAFVSAGIVYDSASFTFTEREAVVSENLTFLCDGEAMSVTSPEVDGHWDDNDVISAIQCKGVLTQVIKEGVTWKQNVEGKKSFIESELTIKEEPKDLEVIK